MLRQLVLVALASAPAVLANALHTNALYANSLPLAVYNSVAADRCILPDDFEIQNLGGISVNGSAFNTLDFTFYDNSTLIQTQCHLNSSSVPLETDGRTPRFLCENDNVQFIFANNKLTIIEQLCPGDDGVEDYESAGSVYPILPACNGTSTTGGMTCALASGPLVSGKFSSVNIVPGTDSTAGLL